MFENRFVRDLFFYAGTSILLNIIATVFRVWVSNKIGAEGMGLYSLVYSVYLPACTLAVSAVNLAATRLVTEALALKKGSISRIIRKCVIYSTIFGTFSCILLYFFAEPIAVYWIKDSAAIFPLRVICFGLPCLSIASGLHGAFTALRKISKSIIVQITEDVTKISIAFALITVFFDIEVPHFGVVALVAGSAVGEIVSCVVAAFLFMSEKRKFEKYSDEFKTNVTKKLLSISIPTAFSAYIRSGLSMFENLMVPEGFRRFGMSESQALSVLGMFKGMVLPVIFFPAALIGSFSRLIVPEMADAYEKNDKKKIEFVAIKSMKMTLIFAIFVMIIFLLFAEKLGKELFSSAEAAVYIRLLAPLVPLMYLDNVVDSLLKGLNGQVASMKINILDSALRCFLVIFFLPLSGFEGYLIITYISTVLNGTLSINRFMKTSKVRFPIADCVFFPALASLSAAFPMFVISEIINPSISVFIYITISSILYIIFMNLEKLNMNNLKTLLTNRKNRVIIKNNIIEEKKRNV